MNIFSSRCFLNIYKQVDVFSRMLLLTDVLILLTQCYLSQVTEGEVSGKFSQDFVPFFRLLISKQINSHYQILKKNQMIAAKINYLLYHNLPE